jgi:hypothetical protein
MDQRRSVWDQAVDSFCRVLEKEAPNSPPGDLSGSEFERILLVHVQALAFIDGRAVKGENGLLDYLLGKERRHWRERLAAGGFSESLVPAISEAMALITLRGGAADRSAGLAMLAELPSLRPANAAEVNGIAEILHESYPGVKWIEPVMPDLLGEYLAEFELNRGGENSPLFALAFGATKTV